MQLICLLFEYRCALRIRIMASAKRMDWLSQWHRRWQFHPVWSTCWRKQMPGLQVMEISHLGLSKVCCYWTPSWLFAKAKRIVTKILDGSAWPMQRFELSVQSFEMWSSCFGAGMREQKLLWWIDPDMWFWKLVTRAHWATSDISKDAITLKKLTKSWRARTKKRSTGISSRNEQQNLGSDGPSARKRKSSRGEDRTWWPWEEKKEGAGRVAVWFGMLVPFASWLTCTFSDPSALLHIVYCHVLPLVSISYDWSNEVSCVLSWCKLLPTNLERRHHCWPPVVVMEFCRMLLSSLLWDCLTLRQAETNDQKHYVSKLCNAGGICMNAP